MYAVGSRVQHSVYRVLGTVEAEGHGRTLVSWDHNKGAALWTPWEVLCGQAHFVLPAATTVIPDMPTMDVVYGYAAGFGYLHATGEHIAASLSALAGELNDYDYDGIKRRIDRTRDDLERALKAAQSMAHPDE